MRGRTPAEAYRTFVGPLQAALNTISDGRLVLTNRLDSIQAGRPLAISLNSGVPTPLRFAKSDRLFIQVAFWALIEPFALGTQRFECRQTAYWYTVTNHTGQELLAYHWTPEVRTLERRYPHLHIGSAASSQSSLSVGAFHKLHLPTNLISIQHLVRFAIQELGVPVRSGHSRDLVLAQLTREIGDS